MERMYQLKSVSLKKAVMCPPVLELDRCGWGSLLSAHSQVKVAGKIQLQKLHT